MKAKHSKINTKLPQTVTKLNLELLISHRTVTAMCRKPIQTHFTSAFLS